MTNSLQESHPIKRQWRGILEIWKFYNSWRSVRSGPSMLRRYLFAAFSVACISLLHWLTLGELGERSPFLLYILAVTFSAWYGGVSAGILSTVLAVLTAESLKMGAILPLQTGIFSFECLVITALIASLRYTVYLSQERATQLRENGDQLRALIDGITDYAIFLLDPKGYVLSWSDAATNIQGYYDNEVLGRKHSMFYLPEEMALGKPEHDLLIAQQMGRHEEEGWVTRKDGSAFWANKVITTLFDQGGAIRGFAHVTRDMTERKQAEDLIRHQAYHDSLTGLPNRLYMQENLTSLLKWASRREELIGILFLDLDRFKAINDSLGHAAGDELLREVAKRLRNAVQPQDLVARIGGDEFVIVLNGIRGPSEILRSANDIAASLREPLMLEGHQLHTQASIGSSLYPNDGTEASTLLQNADTALYQSKRSGRDTVTMYDPEMNAAASQRLSLEAELRLAIERNDFKLYYQPIFSVAKGGTVAAEALIRWNHPTLGIISPGEFIPLAEETGLIFEIGDWVIQEVCRQQAQWKHDRLTIVPIAINLSARQFAQSNLAGKIDHALQRYKVDPSMLTVEVTESVAMQDIESTVAKLNAITQLGVATAIDDFGIGFSSLSYLKQLPLAKVKIDKSFVEHCTTDPRDAAIVKAIISMAHSLKLRVVAEGIETADQLQFLKASKSDWGQGYLVSPPQPAEQFAERISTV